MLWEIKEQQRTLIAKLDGLTAAITETKKRELTPPQLIAASVFAGLFCTLLILVLRG